MSFESKRLAYETVNKKHAAEVEGILCDPAIYTHVDDGIAPSLAELTKDFASSEKAMLHPKDDEVWLDFIIKVKALNRPFGSNGTETHAKAESIAIQAFCYRSFELPLRRYFCTS
ncbi:hypothetical protein S7335_961 [Synechococcus sp. PCC 7335]|uniref:hypothetical protein n=1 Tax=Synechococcus sp. (strain ATCC 29403 / PCC 7335) TaxID=91464 RepID=UPI00017ECF3B|nr:hypothetical protein [Synechococcus sp. PCC 7335]EDX82660.1 hypothetical protein S7335_961 [Synechococcus sp. PCC 7335]